MDGSSVRRPGEAKSPWSSLSGCRRKRDKNEGGALPSSELEAPSKDPDLDQRKNVIQDVSKGEGRRRMSESVRSLPLPPLVFFIFFWYQ